MALTFEQILHLAGMGLILATGLLLLLVLSPRFSLILLALQYGGVFLLIESVWPLPMSLSKLLAGWVAVVVLLLSLPASERSSPQRYPAPSPDLSSRPAAGLRDILGARLSEDLFRTLSAAMAILVVVSLAPRAAEWIPDAGLLQTLSGLLMIVLGLLQLGFTAQVLRVFIGLFTVLSGFEIIYAAVERSALVAGLMAGVTLALALVGAYLLVASRLETDA